MPRPAPTSPVSSAGPHPPRSRQMVGRASGRAARADRAHVPQPRRRAPHRAAGATPPTALPSWSASQVPVVRPWRTWPGPGAPGAGRPRRGRPGRGRRREGTPIALGWAAAWWRARAHPQPLAAVQPCQGVHAPPDCPDLRRMVQAHQAPEGDRAHPGPASARGSPTSAASTPTHQHQRAQRPERRLRQAEHLLGGRQVSGWPRESNREARKTWAGPANWSRCSSSLPRPRAHRHRPAPAAVFVGPRRGHHTRRNLARATRPTAWSKAKHPCPIVNRIELAYGGSDATPCLSGPASGPLATV